MKADVLINWLCAMTAAVILCASAADVPEPEPVQEMPVGMKLDEMVALCRGHYGQQSTVYMRTPSQLACDTREQKVAAP